MNAHYIVTAHSVRGVLTYSAVANVVVGKSYQLRRGAPRAHKTCWTNIYHFTKTRPEIPIDMGWPASGFGRTVQYIR
jgi:hypothetical protein